ncbi:YlxM family DNA-binding protein [Microaceticoccus formicicus]|uniref:YlxM family DNA-binding protein n=1 Tax=Microaceticoccus formicicus TaxID=3118105 RepID=UPI003CD02739|nr:DNA-binding protein [Peptoniphilaceae bacterium AMB_02]
MDDRMQVVLLLDYYGKLLSDKQYNAMVSYYYEDLSLIEIANNQDITKQAVSDLIKRSEKRLYEIEKELGMVKKNSEIRNKLRVLNTHLSDIIDLNEGEEFTDTLSVISDSLNEVIGTI